MKLVDGTMVSLADTAKNQARFPQPRTQQPGLGFPIARIEQECRDGLLAYHLMRLRMLRPAKLADVMPSELSFNTVCSFG